MRSLALVLLLPLCSAIIGLLDGSAEDPELLKCVTGSRKSPIDIETKKVTPVSLPPLKFNNYDISETVTETQSNYTATIHGYANWAKRPTLVGGLLAGNYKLADVHWELPNMFFAMINPFDYYGHTVDGARHDLEVHFVHTKDGMSIEEAQKIEDGIVVVAAFLNDKRNPFDIFGFGGVTNESNLIIPDNAGTDFDWVSPDTLLPTDLQSYYIYNGTLAHPPCDANVTWIVLSSAAEVVDLQHMRLAYTRKSKTNTMGIRQTRKHSDTVLFNKPRAVERTKQAAQVIVVPARSSSTVFLIAILAGVISSAATAFLCCCLNKKMHKSSGSADFPVQHRSGTDYVSLIGGE